MAKPTEADLVAAFLAKGGKVTGVPAAPAYGVVPAVDRARRVDAKVRQAEQDQADFYEREAEQSQQRGVEENGFYKS